MNHISRLRGLCEGATDKPFVTEAIKLPCGKIDISSGFDAGAYTFYESARKYAAEDRGE